MMIKHLLKFLFKLIMVTGLLLAIHYYVILNFFSELILFFPLWSIYAFNAVLVFLVYCILFYKSVDGNEKAYTHFLVLTLGKMVLSIVFLSPLFNPERAHETDGEINFFIPYFLFLSFEIVTLSNFFKNQ